MGISKGMKVFLFAAKNILLRDPDEIVSKINTQKQFCI